MMVRSINHVPIATCVYACAVNTGIDVALVGRARFWFRNSVESRSAIICDSVLSEFVTCRLIFQLGPLQLF